MEALCSEANGQTAQMFPRHRPCMEPTDDQAYDELLPEGDSQ